MAIRTGTASPTLLIAKRPPAFRKARAGEEKRAVEHVFWLTPAPPSEPLTWYCGTIFDGHFESRDGGLTWRPVTGFNDAPERSGWGDLRKRPSADDRIDILAALSGGGDPIPS